MQITQDIPKLYTAFAEWLSCVALIAAGCDWKRKAAVWRFAGTAAAGLCLLCVIQLFCGVVDGPLWLLGMFLAVFVMYGMLRVSLGGSRESAWFLTARAFMRAEWMAALEWQLDRFYAPGPYEKTRGYSALFCLFLYAAVSLAIFFTERFYSRRELTFRSTDVTRENALEIWLFTLLFFVFSNLSYVKLSTPFGGSDMPEIFNIRALADLAGVIMVELVYLDKIRIGQSREADAIQNMLHAQYQQYRQSQENIDLVNRKYHDLKHQIQVLRAENTDGRKLEYLDEMEEEIRQYETLNQTGNPVVDTILTSKSQICLRQRIQLKVVADAGILNHLHVMDLATIFGNALDNAIEHVMQIPDPEKRLIRVNVSRRGNMACILVENYFEGTLRKSEEGYLTTKADSRYHGYGLKSIRYAVEKYHGIFSASVEDGWFRLKIALPVNGES